MAPPRQRRPPDAGEASGSDSTRPSGFEPINRRLLDDDTLMADAPDDAVTSSPNLQPPASSPANDSRPTQSATATPQPRPVPTTGTLQRLTSLRDSAPAGMARGTTGNRLKYQPTNRGRRSKEIREAAENQERERLAAKVEAAAAAARASGLGRGGARIRGGVKVRDRRPGRSIQAASASGPFSASATFGSASASGTARRKPTAAAASTTPRRPKPKTQPASAKSTLADSEDDGKIKSEHEDVLRLETSDEDSLDGDGGGRYNIEYINIISSDEEEEEEDPSRTLRPKPKQTEWNIKPVRLGRREHQERTVDVNTEPPPGTSAELRRRASDKNRRDGLFVASDEEVPVERKAKSRLRDKDVEVVRTWKGVYQDEDDEDDILIKDELADEMILDEVEPDTSKADQAATLKASLKKKHKAVKKKLKKTRPVLQTEEDRLEWQRREEDLRVLVEELGFSNARGSANEADDQDDEVRASKDDVEADSRQGKLYFFQFPPVMPPLENIASGVLNPIEITDDPASGDASKAASATPGTMSAPPQPPKTKQLFPSGLVGKLRVHKSGKVSLSWGGMKMNICRGQMHEFLQNAVAIDHGRNSDVKEEDEEFSREQQTPGKAWSFGEVTGRYVVVPDWEALLK